MKYSYKESNCLEDWQRCAQKSQNFAKFTLSVKITRLQQEKAKWPINVKVAFRFGLI